MFTTIFKNWLYFSVPDLKVKLQKKKKRKKVKLQ